MKSLKDLAKQIRTTGIVTRKFTEECSIIGSGENALVKFFDGKIFKSTQCTFNMKKSNGFEYIDSVTIDLNK